MTPLSLRSTISSLFICLLFKVSPSFCVYCTYYDTIHSQLRSTYCPQICCLTASSIEEACCYSYTWLMVVVLIGMPLVVGLSILALLYLFLRKRRVPRYPNVIMCTNVDPLRVDSFLGIHPLPPPTYQENNPNAASASATIIRSSQSGNGGSSSDSPTSSMSRGDPPAYVVATANEASPSPQLLIKSDQKRFSTSSKMNKRRQQRKKCHSEPIIYKHNSDHQKRNDDNQLI